ncbi:hypothetical protein VTO73DRAFT_3276 [Trametes versicolor]
MTTPTGWWCTSAGLYTEDGPMRKKWSVRGKKPLAEWGGCPVRGSGRPPSDPHPLDQSLCSSPATASAPLSSLPSSSPDSPYLLLTAAISPRCNLHCSKQPCVTRSFNPIRTRRASSPARTSPPPTLPPPAAIVFACLYL